MPKRWERKIKEIAYLPNENSENTLLCSGIGMYPDDGENKEILMKAVDKAKRRCIVQNIALKKY